MLVSFNWLKNYVDLDDVTPEYLAEKITRSGIEVEEIEYVAESSTNVVVGYVESCEKHPNADKLNVTQVDVADEKLQIVCGAANVAQGQKVAVAKPGAVLPGNFKIKKTQLRDVESNGMICSLQELGIKEAYIPEEVKEGIFVFPDNVQIGENVVPLLNLDDAVLELDVLANRADALSMIGVAYEVAAVLDRPVHLPSVEAEVTEEEKAEDYIGVQVKAPHLNPYYGAFVIKDIEVGPSPLWMRNYLMTGGIRPINNVVDVTNYVLLEYGQPLHAFDYDRFDSKQIVVRNAQADEKIVTLDGEERTLNQDQLVVTNGKEATAIAGVMGGANTEVTAETTTVLLEAAYFNGASVRKTVRETGLRSESSTRFEKGIDPNRVKEAGVRASQLLHKYAGGKVLYGFAVFDEMDKSATSLSFSTTDINRRLGTEIKAEEIASILRSLYFSFEQNQDVFNVTIPTRRGDITIFEDILEEVARIYGYDHLPFTLPEGSASAGGLTERQLLKRNIKQYMESAGLMETITYSLTNEEKIGQLISPDVAQKYTKAVSLSKPMSADHKYLRLSILPELLDTLTYNRARTHANIAYYELGKVFISDEENLMNRPSEWQCLSGALTGNWLEHPWQQEKKAVDFYVAKGIVEGLFEFLDIAVAFHQTQQEDMHPGRTASISIDGQTIGFIGQLHPKLAKAKDLKDTYVFDINLEAVFAAIQKVPSYQQIPRYPSTTRDIAFILDKDVQAGDVRAMIEETGAPLVRQVRIFDVYKGENAPEGKKSIAYSLLYQDPEKTLTDDEVEASYQQIIDKAYERFGAYVRS